MSITVSEPLNRCLVTGGSVVKVLDFGQHPYADSFIADNQLHLSEPVFPLVVNLSPEVGMLQLGYISNAEDRYNLYSYSYTSSNSETARTHWNNYAQWIKSRYGSAGLAVEIGSNDGYLIGQFAQGIGVDSSAEMCQLAQARGVTTINQLFDSRTVEQIKREHGLAQVIMANNVFNHANNPVPFAQAVADLLTANGVFVFEVPYWLIMVQSGRFTDMVYHEHPLCFTVRGAWNLLKAAGLVMTDFEIVDYHGGSLRVVAQRDHGQAQSEKIRTAIEQEIQAGLFDPVFYQTLQQQFQKQKIAWLKNFYQLLADEPDAVIIGVGAAAKANTWLRWHGLDATVIRCITDSSEYKQGKYTPLTRIPIVGDEVFAQYQRPYALILSWNINDRLKQAILNINPQTRFISQ